VKAASCLGSLCDVVFLFLYWFFVYAFGLRKLRILRNAYISFLESGRTREGIQEMTENSKIRLDDLGEQGSDPINN